MDKGIECFYSGSNVRHIVVDPVTEKLFVSGTFAEDGNCIPMRGIAQWNGQFWDSIGRGSEGMIPRFEMTMYKDTLYANGNFYNDNTNLYLAKWNGSYWDTISNTSRTILAYAQKDSMLYMGGAFNYTGDTTFMLMKYDGIHLSSILSPCNELSEGFINALAFYHDTLYVGGYYDYSPCKILGSLGKWDGTALQLVSPEFANDGSNCNIEAMVEYQGELYIGGYFLQSHGYAGNFIMKWNGSTFSSVGSGMNNRVRCMKVYNNKLYVGGYFTNAGGVASNYIAMWDGSNWNSMTTDTFNIPGGALLTVDAIDVYRDTLIIGGSFTSINGDTTCRRIAKYNAALTGIAERSKNNLLSIFPNPARDQITIEFASSGNTVLEIKNMLGQTMYSELIKDVPGKQSRKIDVSTFSNGLYFIRLKNEKESVSAKFVKS